MSLATNLRQVDAHSAFCRTRKLSVRQADVEVAQAPGHGGRATTTSSWPDSVANEITKVDSATIGDIEKLGMRVTLGVDNVKW